jgi:V/A-type H+-transporting ATPase subunit C
MSNQNEKYIYVTGRIRARESRMLNAMDLERMIDAPTASESFRVLNDTDFSENLLELPEGKIEYFQKVIDEDLHDMRTFLKKNVPEEQILIYMALKYNFSHLKILFKEKYFAIKSEEDKNILASIGSEFLEECINYQEKEGIKKRKQVSLADMKSIYHLAVKEVVNFYTNSPKKNNPIFIDLILDKHYFAELLEWLKYFKSDFISEYVQAQIDLHNILTFLRLKNSEFDQEKVDLAIIQGGSIDHNIFLNSFSKSIESFEEELKNSKYWIGLADGWDNYLKNNEFWMMERDMDNILVRLLKKVRFIAYGPEVAFAYLWGKHNAARNVRIIMIAKMNNIDPVEIKQKIRELY